MFKRTSLAFRAAAFAIAFLISTSFVSTSASAYYFDVSSWAVSSVNTARTLGIIPSFIIGTDYTQSMTREQFCDLIIRTYDRLTGVPFDTSLTGDISSTPFQDSYNKNVKRAAELGIVAVNEKKAFKPRDVLTRQDTAVMTANALKALNANLDYSESQLDALKDKDSIAQSSRAHIAALVGGEYMFAREDGGFHPEEAVSCEEAVALCLRVFQRNNKLNIQPNVIQITSHTDGSFVPISDIRLTWTSSNHAPGVTYEVMSLTPDLDGYMYPWPFTDESTASLNATIPKRYIENATERVFAIRDSNGVYSPIVRLFIGSKGIRILNKDYVTPDSNGNITISWNKLSDVTDYSVTIVEKRASGLPEIPVGATTTAKAEGASYTFKSKANCAYQVSLKATTSGGTSYSDTATIYAKRSSLKNAPFSYSSKAEAQKDMTKVTFPIWKLSGGKKVESKASVTVHKDLADSVVKIFTQIFNGPEKFPIKDIGGFDWRAANSDGSYSAHNSGQAIDINSNENYCIYPSGRVVGSYWKPGVDPYSITPYGDVVTAFEANGWYWLGDSYGTKDYMHFSSSGK
ncbi:MAG: M15 family metallopeptidase [Clostridiales bacterium]|nr:M15 family metallopeptidase [Clostridiales bacterium]